MKQYARELEQILLNLSKSNAQEKRCRLLLHSCCAPCSSYVLVYLRFLMDITVFYYNPNITREEEYRQRMEEQKRLIGELNKEIKPEGAGLIRVLEGEYEPVLFLEASKGLELCPEGGARCTRCYALRLTRTAREAKMGGYDYFTTTLTISPMKDAQKLNQIGIACGEEEGVLWLPSDFKKKDGYQRSVELSRVYGLYRQDYCGCGYSKAESERRKESGIAQKISEW